MRFVQPIPLLYANNHNHLGNQSGTLNSPPTDNHHHHQLWNNATNAINHVSRPYNLNATTHEIVTREPYEYANPTQRSAVVTDDDHNEDNTLSTVCITSGGDAVSFSKYRQSSDSRRSSQHSTGGGNIDADGNDIRDRDNNSNSLQPTAVAVTRNNDIHLGVNACAQLPRRPSYHFEAVNDADEDPESPSIEDISCMDDDFALSSPSTCPSITDSPEPSNFRGIINPNYPGFHHLAHTLSEHFFDEHHFAHSSEDSDLSEFEVEPDRQPNTTRMRSQDLTQSGYTQFTNNNNNNNNNEESDNTLRKIEDLIRGAFQSRESEPPAYADYTSSGYSRMMDEHPSDNAVDDEEFHAYSVLESQQTLAKDADEVKQHMRTIQAEKDAETRNTPDILRKASLGRSVNSPGHSPEGLEQPDILRNVFEERNSGGVDEPSHVHESDWQYIENNSMGTNVDECNHVKDAEWLYIGKTSGAMDTNVDVKNVEWLCFEKNGSVENVGDIVGNFEQEVEHELGRMVTGYKCTTTDESDIVRTVDPDLLVVQQETIACLIGNAEKMERLLLKMADAVLSDGSDLLLQRNDDGDDDDDASDNNADSAHSTAITHECSVTSSNRDHAPQLNSSSSMATGHVELRQSDSSTSQHDAQSTEPPAVIEYRRQSSLAAPIAAVVPKYKRRSYDDRELPPVVSIDREVPWYHNHISPSPSVNNNTHHQPPGKHRAGGVRENNNVMLSPSSQSQSSSAAATPTRKKIPSSEPTHRFSKKSSQTSRHVKSESFSKEMQSNKDSDRDYDSTTDKGAISKTLADNHNQRTPTDAHVERQKYMDNMSNNNRSSKYSELVNNSAFAAAMQLKASAGSGATKKRTSRSSHQDTSGTFDVYNIETALPKIDLEAIENHLKAAKEEERRKRNDRKEILRRLAMGSEFDPHARADKPLRKPSLHSRLQGGMNLQICFMNETASDTESPSSDSESCPKLSKSKTFSNRPPYSASVAHPYKSRPLSVNIDRRSTTNDNVRPVSLNFEYGAQTDGNSSETDFFTKQARLQIEARMALAQAKDMAHMQMEMERQKQKESPITEIIRNSLVKVGIDFPQEKRRVSRQMLTDMNIAQLQVIVNDLHTQIERLNERLVQYLMERDELHMSQDSMLVDIEDLTRYLGAKEQTTEKPTADKRTILMMSQQQQPPKHGYVASHNRYSTKKTSYQ